MMKRKLTLTFLIVLGCSLALTGCKNGAEESAELVIEADLAKVEAPKLAEAEETMPGGALPVSLRNGQKSVWLECVKDGRICPRNKGKGSGPEYAKEKRDGRICLRRKGKSILPEWAKEGKDGEICLKRKGKSFGQEGAKEEKIEKISLSGIEKTLRPKCANDLPDAWNLSAKTACCY